MVTDYFRNLAGVDATGKSTGSGSPYFAIDLKNQKSTLADLKPGMLVSVTLSDPSRLSRISATTK